MFKDIGFKKILVTGCQRAGTHFTTAAIAHDIGIPYTFEGVFLADDYTLFKPLLKQDQYVIQCPAIADRIHEFAAPDVLIVWVYRNYENIINSQEALGWDKTYEAYELTKYGIHGGSHIIPYVKDAAWGYQAEMISKAGGHWKTVHYEHMKLHPLFGLDKVKYDAL